MQPPSTTPSPEQPDAAAMPEGVYNRSVRSGWWYGADMVVQRVINLAGFLVLVRLLQPEDYGAIAAMLVVAGLFDQFTSIPFGDAMVQRKGDVEEYVEPLWTWDLIRASFIAAAIAVASGWLSDYFGLQGIARALMPWTGVVFVMLPALSNPRQVYFFRRLDMRRVFIRDVVSQSSYLIVAVGYALLVHPSLMALFLGHLARFFSGMVMSYVLFPVRPHLSFAFRRLRALAGFVKWAYAHAVVEFAAGSADRFLVGGLLGVERLGLYTRSRDLSLMASGSIAAALDKVAMPAFARVQDRRDKLQIGFLKSLDLSAIISVPFALILLLEGGALVPILLGPQWIAIVLPLKIFAAGSLAYGLTYILQPLFTGIGRTDISFRLRLVEASVALPLIYIAARTIGPIGLAIAVVTGWVATLVCGAWWSRSILRFDKRDMLPVVLPTAAAAIVTALADAAGRSFIHALEAWWITLGWAAVLGSLYLAALFLISRMLGSGPYETIYAIFSQMVAAIRSRFGRTQTVDNTP